MIMLRPFVFAMLLSVPISLCLLLALVPSCATADKVGICPTPVTIITDEPSSLPCPNECSGDRNCSGVQKCCPSACGGAICLEPTLGRSLCDNIVCGPNSECSVPSLGDAICKCKAGYSGDPNDPIIGCKKYSRIPLMCEYQNKSYGIGEEFFDGCAKRCLCSEALEVDCSPRCAFDVPEGGDLLIQQDTICSIVPDPKDSCCKVISCKSGHQPPSPLAVMMVPSDGDGSGSSSSGGSFARNEAVVSTENTVSVSRPLASDGCRYQNRTYSAGDHFMEACESKCFCEAGGNIHCLPRCATYQGFDEKFCQLQADPADPECCKIAVCDTREDASHDAARKEEPKDDDEKMLVEDDAARDSSLPQSADKKKKTKKRTSPLVLDSVEATNSTNIRLRVILPNHVRTGPSGDGPGAGGAMNAHEHLTGLKALNISYAKVEAHLASQMDRIKLNWSFLVVNESRFRVVDSGLYEAEAGGLEPSTEYFVKVSDASDTNSSSNTVVVRTYPPGIDSSFTGCFHGNRTYEVGQVFYDGCEYKCTCHEGGVRECGERCPVYIDTVGYENCDWQPAPDDSCCTVPVCERPPKTTDREDFDATNIGHGGGNSPNGNSNDERQRPGHKSSVLDPASEPFCIANAQLYSVGQTWQEGDGCLKKQCGCVQLKNASTSVQCHGGCANIPPQALRPSVECPKPEMVTPDDSCLCPYVVCLTNKMNPIHLPPVLPSNPKRPTPAQAAAGSSATGSPHNPIQANANSMPSPSSHGGGGSGGLATPPSTVMSKNEDTNGSNNAKKGGFCDFKGKKIPIGEEVHDDCKAICTCDQDGDMSCALVECPHHFAPHVSECLEWDIEPDFEPEPPNCCPEPKCKRDGSCIFAGLTFPNFKHIPQELLPCGTRCACVNGNVTCENICPPLPDIPPPSLSCPPQMAYRGHAPGDSCCLQWLCREPERPAFCLANGKRYKINEQWDDTSPANGLAIRTHRRCQCKAGTGGGAKPSVACYPGQCPQITERHLRPSPECPIPVVVTPEDPTVMCSYVICNSSEETGKDLDRVSVVAINATAVRVRFTLPQILIGLVGHAELHFTRDPALAREQWGVQKFARPKRLFDTANIEYHLGRLRPDTVYFFQIRVVVEALQGGPESEIYRLKMPGLPTTTPGVTSTTSTTTTTTTLPPIIVVDSHINVIPGDYSSATIAWKPLELSERALVDGIQIKYKRAEESDHSWLTTPMIHRDLTSYVLRDLQAGASYMVDIVYRTAVDLQTVLVSARPVLMDMPSKPRDEFEFHVSIDPINDVFVDSSRSVFHLRGAPHPANKYITVAKISYKVADSSSGDGGGQMIHTFRVPSDDGTVVLEGLSPRKRYKAWVDLYLANGRKITSNVVDFTTKEGSAATGSGKSSSIDQRSDDPSANEAEALHRDTEATKATTVSEDIKPYYIALTIVALFAAVTGVGFVTLLCVLLKAKSTAKAPITRAPSESAYDNPTYKTYDNERGADNEPIKNGSVQA